MSASGYVSVEVVRIKRATEKALLCVLENEYGEEGEEKWLPRSIVADEESYEAGDEGLTLSILEWFAVKEDIPYEEM